MAGYTEVARVSAVVEANIAPFEQAMTRGEQRTDKFAATAAAALQRAENATESSSRSMARALERAGVAHSAAAAAAERAIAKVTTAHNTGAAAAQQASQRTVSAMSQQASATMQAGAMMGQSQARMASSAEAAAAAISGASSRAAQAVNSQAAATRVAGGHVVREQQQMAAAAEKSAAVQSAAATRSHTAVAGAASKAAGFAKSMAAGVGLVGGYGLATALAGVIKTGATFNQTMSGVRAATGATQAEFDALRGTAIALGTQTAFSATEVGAAMTELGKSGFNARQNIAAIPGVLDAAAASGEGISQVASIVASSLAQFNLDAKESTRVADVLAGAANLTQGSITSMGEALKYAGTGAAQLGFDIEQTTGMIAAMVKAGIDGSQAGTSVRMGLQQLSLGKMIPAADLARLKEISPELARIQKSTMPLPAKLLAVSAEYEKLTGQQRNNAAAIQFGTNASSGFLEVVKRGPSAIEAWTQKMRDSDGAAKKFGATLRDNLAGDVEQLKGALESAAIKASDVFDDDLRSNVVRLRMYVDSAQFQSDAQAVVGTVIAVGEAVGHTTAFLLEHRGAIVAAAAAYASLRTAAAAAAGASALAGAGAALVGRGGRAGAVSGAATIGATGAAAAANVGRLASFARVASMAARGLTGIGLATVGVQLLYEYSKASAGAGESVEETTARVDRMVAATEKIRSKKEKIEVEIVERRTRLEGPGGDGARRSPRSAADDDNASRRAQAEQDNQTRANARELNRLEGQINDKIDQRVKKRSLAAYLEKEGIRHAQMARELEATPNRTDWEEGLRAKAVKFSPIQLRGADEARRDVTELDDAIEKLTRSRSKLARSQVKIDLGASPEAAKKLIEDMSDADRKAAFHTTNVNKILSKMGYVKVSGVWYDSLNRRGMMGNAIAERIKGQINGIVAGIGAVIPSRAWVDAFAADFDAARAKAAGGITVQWRYQRVGALPNFSPLNALKPGGHATGGRIIGPGTGTSDSILARLSNGEHVLTAREVERMGGHDAVERLRAAARAGTLPAYADGGAVSMRGKKPKPPKATGAKATTSQEYLDAARAAADQSAAKLEMRVEQQRRALVALQKKEEAHVKRLNAASAALAKAKAGLKGKSGKALKDQRKVVKDKQGKVADQRGVVADIRDKRKSAAEQYLSLGVELRDTKIREITSVFDGNKSSAERRLAEAKRTPGTEDDKAAEQDLRNIATARATALQKLLSEKPGLPKGAAAIDAETRRALEDQLAGAIDDGAPPDAEAEKSAFEALQERYGLRFAELDAALADAEGTPDFADDKSILGQIAATYAAQRGELRGLLPSLKGGDVETAYGMLASASRGEQDATKRAAEGLGGSAASDDQQALLAQAQRQRDEAMMSARMSEAALATFGGAASIGYGGGANAYQAGAGARPADGGVHVTVNTLSGYDPGVKAAIAHAADGGFSQGGNQDKLWSGRR